MKNNEFLKRHNGFEIYYQKFGVIFSKERKLTYRRKIEVKFVPSYRRILSLRKWTRQLFPEHLNSEVYFLYYGCIL